MHTALKITDHKDANKNILDEKYIIDPILFSDKGFIKLSIGKKKHFKITV